MPQLVAATTALLVVLNAPVNSFCGSEGAGDMAHVQRARKAPPAHRILSNALTGTDAGKGTRHPVTRF